MAAGTVTCGCGGEYEGTPSRKARHESTAKHLQWVGARQAEARKVQKPVKVPAASSAQAQKTTHTSKASLVRSLLDAGTFGSLSAIAEEAGVSYEYAWDIRSAWLKKAGQ